VRVFCASDSLIFVIVYKTSFQENDVYIITHYFQENKRFIIAFRIRRIVHTQYSINMKSES